MSEGNDGKSLCAKLLCDKAKELASRGVMGYPKKSDFSEEEAAMIKAFLGPWPRALEKAGLKEPRTDDIQQKNREKRIRAKRNRIQAMKNKNNK